MGCKGPPCCQDSLKGQTPAAQRGPMYSGGWRMTVSFPPRARARKPEGALCSSLAVSFLEGPSVCGEQVSGSARGGGGGGLASSTGCETLGGLVHKTGFPWLPKSDPWGLGEAGGGGGCSSNSGELQPGGPWALRELDQSRKPSPRRTFTPHWADSSTGRPSDPRCPL